MSFSYDIKVELSKINNLKDKYQVYSELLGYLSSKNAIVNKNKMKYSTENEYNINRFAKLLNNINIGNYDIELNGKTYIINSSYKRQNDILENLNPYMENYTSFENEMKKIENKSNSELIDKAYVRGAFLGGGSINDPNRNYHLEILFNSEEYVDYTINLLSKYDIKCKKMINDDIDSLYIKDGEEISKLLAFIGANSSTIKYEEIRVLRNMSNNINRIANCETANIDKTINAAAKQMALIKEIREKGLYNTLPDNLKEIIDIREEYPNVSLEEIGKRLSKPIGKSSVLHRFKKIEEYLS